MRTFTYMAFAVAALSLTVTGCTGAAKGTTSAELNAEREAEIEAKQAEVMAEEAAHRKNN